MNIFNQKWDLFPLDIFYKSESVFGPRRQDAFQLVYVSSGRMEISVDDQAAYTLLPGAVTLLLPGHMETLRFAANTHQCWCYACTSHYDEALLLELSKRPQTLPLNPRMRQLQTMIADCDAHGPVAELELRTRLIEALFYEFFRMSGCFAEDEQSLHPAIRASRDYMRQHLDQPLNLDQIARASGITPTHLIRLYQQNLDTTPIRLLWDMRLTHASTLIQNSGLSIKEVAHRCGFSNAQHFSTAFRKRFGQTPREVRS